MTYVITVKDKRGKTLHVIACASFEDATTRLKVLMDPCVFGNDDFTVTTRPISMA